MNDLNLTMRLDCEMQALRREAVRPAALVRQVAADFLNSGMAEGFPVEVELPEEPATPLQADAFLLRRALNNLLTNCVRHNPPGCAIQLGSRREGDWWVLWVESGSAPEDWGAPEPGRELEEDGGAAHGTGMKLVSQIAASHGGRARFFSGTSFLCELWLPAH